MSVATFIPELWSAQMLTSFREQAVAAGLSNREYEGILSRGNTVHINTAVDVAVYDYSIGEANGGTTGSPLPRTTAPDAVSSTDQELLIDQEKNFDFLIDDVDRVQAAGSMDAFTTSAGLGLAEDADKFLLKLAHDGAATANKLDGDGVAPDTGDEAHDIINLLRKTLNKNHVPKAQRVLFVNAEFESLLLGANSKLTSVDTSGTTSGLREAMLGRYLGFDIYSTENLPVVNAVQAVALWRPALAYVSQIDKTEAMRSETSFKDRLRGLHVYGGRVIRDTAVATWNVGTAP